MDIISLLRQASKADRAGNYRLADSLFNRAYRYAGGEAAIEEALVKALEEAGIKSGEAMAADAIRAAIDKAILEAKGGNKASLEALLREVGAAEEDVPKLVEEATTGVATEEQLMGMAEKISAKMNSPEGIARRMGLKTNKPNFFDKGKKLVGNIGQKVQGLMKKLGPKGVKILAGVGITAVAVGGIWYFTRNGKPVADEEVDGHLSETDPYENMYQKRMDAGQQQRQGDAAQKFFEENKDKFKTQREFYDAALAAGDRNFANSVIALVKRDIPEMEVGSRKNNNF